MPRQVKGERKWHKQLLTDSRVAGWYENLARRDRSVADNYLGNVARNVRTALDVSPVALLDMPQPELEDAVSKCIQDMFDRELLGSTVKSFYFSLTSFLHYHGRKIERDNTIPGANDSPNAENETLYDKQVLHRVLGLAEVRTRAMLLVVAHGGQRPQVMGKADASDGLRLRDLVELVVEEQDVRFTKIPTRVEVSRALSKNRRRFFFFLGPEACEAILGYLRTRMKNGEVLTPESPLFRPYGGESRFMIRNNVSDAIRRAMRDAGLQGRPYIWRSYYAHYCQQVESKGFLEAWRKFFMGHKGNIQTLYANRKANIPPGSIELMRQSYELALPLLETGEDRHQDPTMRMVALVLRSAKATSEHVQRLNLDSSTEDELVQILEDAIKASLVSRAETLSAATEPEAFRQRLVQPNELAQALQEGWFIKLQLSDGQVVVERHTLYTQTPAKHVPLAA